MGEISHKNPDVCSPSTNQRRATNLCFQSWPLGGAKEQQLLPRQRLRTFAPHPRPPSLCAPELLGLRGTMAMRIAINRPATMCKECSRDLHGIRGRNKGGRGTLPSCLNLPHIHNPATTLSQTSSDPTCSAANRCLSCFLQVAVQTPHASVYSLLPFLGVDHPG